MLQGLLIEKMENRILVGITMFVGIMILFGWVAINESARMRSFERQFEARAIERGAEKFAASCSSCHGEYGLGIGGRAPALNNPHFFGYDFFGEQNNQIKGINQQITTLNAEAVDLTEEAAAEDTSEERQTEITTRLQEISTTLDSLKAEKDDLESQKEEIAAQLKPATLVNLPINVDDDKEDGTPGLGLVIPTRLEQVGWAGSLEQYIITTLNHGRPGSASYWNGNQMVAWAQRGGGPLRDDQIQDIATFILNWDKGNDWTIADALAVQQYGRLIGKELEEARASGGSGATPVGTDVQAIAEEIAGLTGDAANGEALYNNQEATQLDGGVLGCSGCHLNGVVGPDVVGTWTRVVNERLTVAQFDGYTPEEYLIDSIVLPNGYIVPGRNPAMPQNFGDRLTAQELADIIAFLATQTQ